MIQGCFSTPSSPLRTTNSSCNNSSRDTNINTSSSKDSLITCIYSASLLDSPLHLTLTWSKTPSSHTLTIYAPDYFSITLSLLPSTFSLFRSRAGLKSIRVGQCGQQQQQENNRKVQVYYDFTRAELIRPDSAEPGSGFYLAIVCNGRVEFWLGDMAADLTRRLRVTRLIDSSESRLMSRREHVFGRRKFVTRAEFLGSGRAVEIECSGGAMKVKFDGETKLHVKKLAWKFRGNEKIFINGVTVEFYWDVFNWINNNNSSIKNNGGNGVFVFQVGEGGVSPEVVGPEKKLMRKNSPATAVALSPAESSSSVWQWAEENSDCGGRSSSGSSFTTTKSSGSFSGGGGDGGGGGSGNSGFSLVLYAWRRG